MLSSPIFWISLGAIFSAAAAICAGVAGWRTLAEQDRQIATLEAWATGGDSFVYFVPLRVPGKIAYFIRHGGRYPAFDVYVRVQTGDGNLIDGPIQVGTVRAGAGMDYTPVRALIFDDPPRGNSESRSFRIETQTRSDVMVQRVHLKVISGRWHTESKEVVSSNRGRLSLPAFPEVQDQ